jgi:hypothetical protein
MMMMMMISMGLEYVSELRPPSGLLLIPQVRYKHGEPWWKDIDRVKVVIRPPQLSGNPTSSHLVGKQEDLEKEIINFALRNISFVRRRVFSMPQNLMTWGRRI